MSVLRRFMQRFLTPLRGGSVAAWGERLAAAHLRRGGYRIVERNLRIGKDEADIIAIAPDGRTLVIVEVKSRVDDSIVPEAQVSRKKMRNLARIAAALQRQRRFGEMAIRFDVIAVVLPPRVEPVLRHHEHAFESPF